MSDVSEERLRNTRAWAAARLDVLAGAEVIVSAIDEVLRRRQAERWQTMESAPKDGTTILVLFKQHGPVSVRWDDPHGDDPYIWCVDDFKHGPYAVRGYCEGDDLGWMPLPISDLSESP